MNKAIPTIFLWVLMLIFKVCILVQAFMPSYKYIGYITNYIGVMSVFLWIMLPFFIFSILTFVGFREQLVDKTIEACDSGDININDISKYFGPANKLRYFTSLVINIFIFFAVAVVMGNNSLAILIALITLVGFIMRKMGLEMYKEVLDNV